MKYTTRQVRRILGTTHVNVAVATNWRTEHVGYPGFGGFYRVLSEPAGAGGDGLTFDKLIDRGGAAWRPGPEAQPCVLPVRRPLRPLRWPFWLRFPYVTSALVKKC
jgi:hypothetical protein